ncbi:MAG: hypothetical protein AAF555_04395 [Verrucomicrobiota bacterium]
MSADQSTVAKPSSKPFYFGLGIALLGLAGGVLLWEPWAPQDPIIKTIEVLRVPESERKKLSPTLEAILEYVEMGDAALVFADVEGEFERLGEDLNAIVKPALLLYRESVADRFDAIELFREFGLTEVKALGKSSRRMENGMYHNRSMLLTGEGFEGVQTLFGTDSRPFAAYEIAPGGADVIVEFELKLGEALGRFSRYVESLGIEGGEDLLWSQIERDLGESPFSREEIYAFSNTRITMVLDFDQRMTAGVPGFADVSMPVLDGLVAVEGLGPLFPKIVQMETREGAGKNWRKGELEFLSLSVPPLPGPTGFWSPVLARDHRTERLFLASREEYLEAALEKEAPLIEDADFVAATEGLPGQGLSLVYLSRAFNEELWLLFSAILDEQGYQEALPVSKESVRAVESILIDRLLPVFRRDSFFASVTAIVPEGFVTASNAPFSHRRNILKPGFNSLVSVAALSGLSWPVYNSITERAKLSEEEAKLRQIAIAIIVFAAEEGRAPESLREIEAAGLIEDPAVWLTREGEAFLYFAAGSSLSDPQELMVASPRALDNQRAVVYADGRSEALEEEAFYDLLEGQP